METEDDGLLQSDAIRSNAPAVAVDDEFHVMQLLSFQADSNQFEDDSRGDDPLNACEPKQKSKQLLANGTVAGLSTTPVMTRQPNNQPSTKTLPNAEAPDLRTEVSDSDSAFVCSICMDPTRWKEPVVTQCGHLYCWPCLYRWIHSNHTSCPVCKAGVTVDNVIPIFIKDSDRSDREDDVDASEEEKVPPRPSAHRPAALPTPEEEANNVAPIEVGYSNTGLLSFSGSLGIFPSSLQLGFAQWTWQAAAEETEEEMKQRFLMLILLVIGVSIILCLLLL